MTSKKERFSSILSGYKICYGEWFLVFQGVATVILKEIVQSLNESFIMLQIGNENNKNLL